MQHGESGAPVPRRIAKIMGKRLCGNEQRAKVPHGTGRFTYGQDRTGAFKVVTRKQYRQKSSINN